MTLLIQRVIDDELYAFNITKPTYFDILRELQDGDEIIGLSIHTIDENNKKEYYNLELFN